MPLSWWRNLYSRRDELEKSKKSRPRNTRLHVEILEDRLAPANLSPVAIPGGPYQGDLGAALTLNGNDSFDPDASTGDTIVSYQWLVADSIALSGATPSLSVAQVGNLGAPGTTFLVQLTVRDSFGETNTDSTTLIIFDNRPFANFTAIPNPSSPNEVITFDASLSYHGHPSRSIVIYDWDFGEGTAVRTTNPTINHSFPLFGNYTVRLGVIDDNEDPIVGFHSVVVEVSRGNRPPNAAAGGPYEVEFGSDLTLNGRLSTDPDTAAGDAIVSYQWLVANSITLTGATPTLTASQLNALGRGTFPVELSVTDTFGEADAVQTTLTIGNRSPVLAAIGNKNVAEGSLLTFTPTATDPDTPANTLTFSLDNGAPAGASITTGGDFTWTPTEAQGQGDYQITVRVTDNGSPTLSAFKTITVHVAESNQAPILASIGNQNINEGSLLTFTATATDADTGTGAASTRTFTLAGTVPSGAAITGVGVFTWTPTEAQGAGTYTFDVVVSDNGSPALSHAETIMVTVAEVNIAPVLAAIGNKSINEETLLTFTATATDADTGTGAANTRSFSLSGAPSGATISSSAGVFSWTPTEAQGAGTYTFDVVVSDNGSPALSHVETIMVTVAEVNIAPVLAAIGNKSINEETLLTFTATATDADTGTGAANIRSFSLSGAPSGATISSSAGDFTWTPTEAQGAGTYTFDVVVSDNGIPALTDTETITVTVNEVNVVPVASSDSYEVNEDNTLTVVAASGVLANDRDADSGDPRDDDGDGIPNYLDSEPLNASQGSQNFGFNGMVAFKQTEPTQGTLTLNKNGSFTYTPNLNYNGTDSFTYLASDGLGNSAPTTVSININSVNDAPVLAAIGNKSVNEENLLTFTAIATDADQPANTLTFTLVSGAPAGASITGGVFTWTPTELRGAGDYTVTVRVADNGSPAATDFETIAIHVNEVNVAPFLATIGNKSVDEETLLAFTATATDADLGIGAANTRIFSLAGAVPSGAAITSAGDFTWTPTEAQGAGTYTFDVVVNDNGSPNLTDSETITVTVNEVNLAPVLAAIGNKTIPEESAFTFTATATDADLAANTLIFSLDSGAATGAGITSAGAFSWTPTEAQGAGDYSVTVRVTDNGSPAATDFETFTIHVNEVNVAPVLTAIGNKSVDEETLLTFTATATDADTGLGAANTRSFSLFGQPAGASITSAGVFTWTPTEAQGAGTYTFDVVVSDNSSPVLSPAETITVSVSEVNAAPTVTAPANQGASEGTANSFTLGSFTDPDLGASWTIDVDWGDGTAHTTFTQATPGSLGSQEHTYADGANPNTVRTVTVKVTEINGVNNGTGSFQVTVNNMAPTPIINGALAISLEGTPITLAASARDPSSADTAEGFTFAWTVSKNSVAGFATGSGTTFSFTPNDNGSYDATLTTTDKDSTSGSTTVNITVNNVAPTILVSGLASVDVGAVYNLTLGTVVDPGADTVASYTISWGDGESNNFSGSPNGLNKTHIYRDGAVGGTSRTIRVDLTDEDGTFAGAASRTITVIGTNVLSWGANQYGQLGDGTYGNRFRPGAVSRLTNVIAVAGKELFGLALRADGTVWAWGDNRFGQLGDGTFTQRTTPVQVTGLNNVIAIAAGGYHALALKSDGTVWAWGSNQYGQLGNGGFNRPTQVIGLSNVTAIAAGGNHSLALISDRTVRAWGANGDGQLGDGTLNYYRPFPAQVLWLGNVTAIAAGAYHSLALISDGTVRAWGYNGEGQLGDGTTARRPFPVPVIGLSNATAIAAGAFHSLALISDGTVRTWGYNYSGQLGDGTPSNRPYPGIVSGVSGVGSITAMGYSSLVRLALQPNLVGGGSAVNGYLVGSTAFLDANFNGVLDPNEPWALTDAMGKFDVQISSVFDSNGNGALDDDEGQWVVYGGTDSSTGLPAVDKLIAPGSWKMLTPLTTLVSILTANYGMSTADAANRVEEALGLPNVDLGTLNPIAETLTGNTSAPAIFAAHAQVQDTISQALALFAGAGGGPSNDELAGSLLDNLVSQIVAPGSTLDLNQAAAITTLLEATQVSSGVTLGSGVVAGAASVIAATNQAVEMIPFTSDVAFLSQVAQVKNTSQGVVAANLQQAAKGEVDIASMVENNTGAALAAQVAASAPPPTILSPGNIFAEATSMAGAVVSFNALATNLAGGLMPVVSSPSSGSLFPLGTTTVTISATNTAGQTSTATFIVTVRDTSGPVLVVPADLVVQTTETGGASVTLPAATATDLVDPNPTWSYDLSSGFFPLGRTLVTATGTDALGNTSTASFTVIVTETTPPETSITAGPASLSTSTTASFSFQGSDQAAVSSALTYLVSLDSSPFVPTTETSQDFTDLSQGPHTFQVKAVDPSGNEDPTPATFTWTVDAYRLDTTLDDKPSLLSNSPKARFTFSGQSVGASPVAYYQTSLDGGAWKKARGGSQTYSKLADGQHTFQVRVVDKAGHVDASLASFTWTVDTTKPTTTLLSSPTAHTNSAAAAFSYTGEDTSGIEYYLVQLDKGRPQQIPDTSLAFTDLANGLHTLQVWSVDQAGNQSASAAKVSWKVDTLAPETSIKAKPASLSALNKAPFTFQAKDGKGSGLDYYEVKLDNGNFTRVSSPRQLYANLAAGPHTLEVRAVDKAGNADLTPATYSWLVTAGLHLHFLQGPSDAVEGKTMAPVVLQLRDNQGNNVPQKGVIITVKIFLPSKALVTTKTLRTNAHGQVVVDDLSFNRSGTFFMQASSPKLISTNLVSFQVNSFGGY